MLHEFLLVKKNEYMDQGTYDIVCIKASRFILEIYSVQASMLHEFMIAKKSICRQLAAYKLECIKASQYLL